MNNEFLGKESVGKLLFKLSIPTVAAQLINMLYNLVDRIFIGKMDNIGDLALTGVGVCLPLIMIVSAFAALISSGGAPRASIFMGKKDNQTAERIMGNCFLLQIIISVLRHNCNHTSVSSLNLEQNTIFQVSEISEPRTTILR